MSLCSKELFTAGNPVRKVDAPKRESLLCKRFWCLPMALQASFHICLITEAKTTYLLPYSGMGSFFPWTLSLRHLENPLPVASLSRFSSKQSFKTYCQDPSLCSPAYPWTALLKGGLCSAHRPPFPSPCWTGKNQTGAAPDNPCAGPIGSCNWTGGRKLWERGGKGLLKENLLGYNPLLFTQSRYIWSWGLEGGFSPLIYQFLWWKNQCPVYKGLAISSPTMRMWECMRIHEPLSSEVAEERKMKKADALLNSPWLLH